MGKRIDFGESQNEAEEWAFEFLEAHLPNEIEFLTNIEVLSESGQPFEVDAIVLAPWAIHFIDVKGYYGSVMAGKDVWEIDGRHVENPLPKANHVARMFAGRVRKRIGPNALVPWCQGGSFITGRRGESLSLTRSDHALCAWGPDEIIKGLLSKNYVTSAMGHKVTGDQWAIAKDVAGQTEAVLRRQNVIGDFHRKDQLLKKMGLQIWTADYQQGQVKRRFLLKLVDPSGFPSEAEASNAVARLKTEASLYFELAGLAGIPYVAPLIDTGEELALPIRLPAGRAMSHIDPSALSRNVKLKALRSASVALQGIHDRGLCHGALKPDSLFVSDSGEVELLDITGQSTKGRDADLMALKNIFQDWFGNDEPRTSALFKNNSLIPEAVRAAVTLDLDPSAESVPVLEPVKLQPKEIVADHFRLIEEFRRDTGVSMWRARHVVGRFDCALLINDQGADGFGRVQAEFEMLGRIFHPNICRVFEAGSIDEEHHYIARAWVNGRSLNGLIFEDGALPEDQVLMCARQAASAIQYLHSAGITHRNIKPTSMILEDDNIVLVDLGMTDPDDTRSGSIMFRDPRVPETGWNEEADLFGLSLTLLCAANGVAEPPLRTSNEWIGFIEKSITKLPKNLRPGVEMSMKLFPDGLPTEYLDFYGLKDDEQPLIELPEEFRKRWNITPGYMEFLTVDMINDGRARVRRQWVLGALRSRRISGNTTNYGSMNATVSRLFREGVAEKYRTKVRLTEQFLKDWGNHQ